jgi:hypothetical protein
MHKDNGLAAFRAEVLDIDARSVGTLKSFTLARLFLPGRVLAAAALADKCLHQCLAEGNQKQESDCAVEALPGVIVVDRIPVSIPLLPQPDIEKDKRDGQQVGKKQREHDQQHVIFCHRR